jgi:hypothetical protein
MQFRVEEREGVTHLTAQLSEQDFDFLHPTQLLSQTRFDRQGRRVLNDYLVASYLSHVDEGRLLYISLVPQKLVVSRAASDYWSEAFQSDLEAAGVAVREAVPGRLEMILDVRAMNGLWKDGKYVCRSGAYDVCLETQEHSVRETSEWPVSRAA